MIERLRFRTVSGKGTDVRRPEGVLSGGAFFSK